MLLNDGTYLNLSSYCFDKSINASLGLSDAIISLFKIS